MALSAVLLTTALVPFQITPFIKLGETVDGVEFSESSFVEKGRNELFVVGALETKGGRFLAFIRTNGHPGHTVRQIELLTFSPDSPRTFDVETTGSCDWLKKRLSLAYGAPVLNEASTTNGYTQRKINWQDSKLSLVVAYWEGTSNSMSQAQDCGLKAEVVE